MLIFSDGEQRPGDAGRGMNLFKASQRIVVDPGPEVRAPDSKSSAFNMGASCLLVRYGWLFLLPNSSQVSRQGHGSTEAIRPLQMLPLFSKPLPPDIATPSFNFPEDLSAKDSPPH